MKIKLCEQYSFLRLLSLKEELSVLPNVKPGILRGRPIVRCYYKNNRGRLTYKTYSEENDEGKRYFRIAARRAEIKDEIASIESALGKSLFGKLSRFSVKTGGSILNEELWNTAGNDENPIEKRGSYYHNGIQMRSRTEVLVAEILDELGLQYKYEPAIKFDSEVFYPDFLVYIEGLKRCLIIEFYGKSDDEGYLYKNVHKMSVYANCGLIMYRDVLGLYGTKETMVSNTFIYNSVVTVINQLALEALVLE